MGDLRAEFGALGGGPLTVEVGDEDEAALLDKASALGPAADMALLDALTRWREQGAEHTAWSWSQLGVRLALT